MRVERQARSPSHAGENEHCMDIDIKIYNSFVKALKTDSGEQDKVFCCLFPSLSAPCTVYRPSGGAPEK